MTLSDHSQTTFTLRRNVNLNSSHTINSAFPFERGANLYNHDKRKDTALFFRKFKTIFDTNYCENSFQPGPPLDE